LLQSVRPYYQLPMSFAPVNQPESAPVIQIVTLRLFLGQLKTIKLLDVRRFLTLFCLISCAVQFSRSAPAQSLSDSQAQALVSRALTTELRLARDPDHPMRYQLRRSTPRLTSTKEIIETRDGDVARLLSVNDKPLAPGDDQKELARLGTLAANPSLQKHRKDSEDEDASLVMKLLRMLPHAFLYQYAGSLNGPEGTVHRFTFRPNPAFNPPDLETQALTAMNGELRIGAAQERVIRLEGHLQQDTNYGWGLLGKLNKGGWVILEQANVGDQQWRIVNVQMEMNIRVLFRNKYINTTEQMTRYAPVPAGMDYRQAIEILRNGSPGAEQGGR
jgi:hypothetical protein